MNVWLMIFIASFKTSFRSSRSAVRLVICLTANYVPSIHKCLVALKCSFTKFLKTHKSSVSNPKIRRNFFLLVLKLPGMCFAIIKILNFKSTHRPASACELVGAIYVWFSPRYQLPEFVFLYRDS